LIRHSSIGIVVVCAASLPLWGQIANGGFESAPNHLAGWTVGGGARVEALQSTNFPANAVIPPEGSWMALLSSGPGDVGGPGGDFDANGVNEFDRATLSIGFNTAASGETLQLSWAFLTDEVGPGQQGSGQFDDILQVLVDGLPVLGRSVRKPGGVSPFPDTVAYDGLSRTVASAGLTDGSNFGSDPGGGATPFQDLCIEIPAAGAHTLEFLVADQGDRAFDSGLLIDDVQLGNGCNPTIQVTDSDEAMLQAKGGGLLFNEVTNGPVASSADGSTRVFRSDGDYIGNNPNLQEQIWIAERNGASFDISPITAAVSGQFGDPDISSEGAFVVFASTAALAGANSTTNFELFRYEVATQGLTAITDTMSCTNRVPSVNIGGSRIAFESDCGFGISASGLEIVYWDGSFSGIDSTGCVSRDPRVSRDGAGRYVTFVTDCTGQYPNHPNGDGSWMALQWDTLASPPNNYLQVVDAPTGTLVEGVDSSADGARVSFVSNADLTGDNPFGDFAVFVYERGTASLTQISSADPTRLHLTTAIDDTAGYIAADSVNLAGGGGIDIVLYDVGAPGVPQSIAPGSASITNSLPDIGVLAGQPRVAFQSNGNFSGNNTDLNTEIWSVGVTVAPPMPTIYCSTPNASIPDNNNQGVRDTLSVAAGGNLTDLDVWVRVDHTWVGDLRVILRHMGSGTQRRLLNRPGVPPRFGCGGDDIDATFDQSVATAAEGVCVTPGPFAIEGDLRPDQSLNNFNGVPLAGDWRLTVSDRASFDTGTFLEWCLIPTTP